MILNLKSRCIGNFNKINIKAMKKILILTFILIVSFTSMSFRGCDRNFYVVVVNILNYGHALFIPKDGITKENYSIYVGENGVIVRSSGETNIIFEQKTSGTTQRLNHVRVTSSTFDQTVLAVGNNGAIVYSTNTGNNWSVSPPVTSANLYGAELNSTYFYAVGDNGTVLLSATGGTIWGQIPSGTTRNLKAIGLNPNFESVVIAVGEKGTILRSTDSGLNWTNISLADTIITFYDISKEGIYFEANLMCIVGNGGRIYKSTNQGATWVQKPSGTTNTLRSIYFHTVDSAVVVGDNGTLRLTTNGGETWFTDPFFDSPSTRHFKAVSLVNRDNKTYSALSDTLFFVSNEPLILGLNNINTAIPQTISLGQNYPNPFNPSTKIKFALPKGSSVQLIIYDILGKEVTKLVNEKLQAGTYEYEWNGINLPSGVYFYKLRADDFSETRKMLMVK